MNYPIRPNSVIVVVSTNLPELLNLDLNFNGEDNVGIIHKIGISLEQDYLLIGRPNKYNPIQLLIPCDAYEKHCTELLKFLLYNN